MLRLHGEKLKANQLIRELTKPLKIKPKLVVKNTHTELLLLSESLKTDANGFHECVTKWLLERNSVVMVNEKCPVTSHLVCPRALLDFYSFLSSMTYHLMEFTLHGV